MPPLPPVIILVRPTLAENIGAAARAMANFGARDLRLVLPAPFDMDRARRMACDGLEILERATTFLDLHSALADCNYSIATSRRLRRIKLQAVKPSEAAARLRSLAGNPRIALVFGAEQSGLTNEELYLCDAASTIPASPTGSLNLAQSVVIFLYEWFQSGQPASEDLASWDRLATDGEKQRNYALLERLLLAADYRPRSRLPEFMRRVKMLFEKRPLTFREQKILMKTLRYFEKLIPK